MKKKVFLVTTALEETWKFDQPVLFLGTWCLCYQRKHIWEKIDGETLSFHWADYSKLQSDYHYLNDFEKRVFPELVNWLNNYHGVFYTERYWRILIGPWFTYFLHIVFERWESIRIANEKYDIVGTTIIISDDQYNIPNNMFEFADYMGTDKWNHYIISKVCESFFEEKTFTYLRFKDKLEKIEGYAKQPTISFKGKIANSLFTLYKKITKKITRKNIYFIGSSYMGTKNETLLNLRLGQLPTFYELRVPAFYKNDASVRKLAKFKYISQSKFELFFANMIISQIPVCFFEGYQNLIKEVSVLPFPQSPQRIFTSNFLAFDSLTMAYTAEHVNRGAKLFHGQHGGYGIPAFMNAFDHEKNISDNFLSWGKIQHETENLIPVGMLKPVSQYKIKGSPNNNNTLLLVRGLWSRFTFRLDSGSGLDLNDTILNCIKFTSLLNEKIREKSLSIRLFPKDFGYGEEERWKSAYPDVQINNGGSISKLISKSRLVIYTYNIGTGYIEYLSANVPTIAFWDMKTSPVSEIAAPYFEEFKRVGIFHDTPESLASHVNNIWNDVESWWQSSIVQLAVNNFLNRFAINSENVVENVAKIIEKEVKHI